MISVQLRQSILNLLWEGGYKPLSAGVPVPQATLDEIQRMVRHEPLDGEPPPPPVDLGARIKAAPSQWAKNFQISPSEVAWAVANEIWTDAQSHTIANFWFYNGVKGRRAPDGRYLYYTYPDGVETEHVDDGGADAATTAASGKTIPGPVLP